MGCFPSSQLMMASGGVAPASGLINKNASSVGVEKLAEKMNDMKVRDDKKMDAATLVYGNETEIGHIIVTTIGGKNGQPKYSFWLLVYGDSSLSFMWHGPPLQNLALKGNKPEGKHILEKEEKLKHAAIARGWPTVLHIVAGAYHIHFVKELLKILDDNAIELKDVKGNTALCFAAAAGNMEIVDLLLKRIPHLPIERGGNGYTPIQFATLQGRCKVTWHLYDKIKHCFKVEDWNLLCFACIYTGIYEDFR